MSAASYGLILSDELPPSLVLEKSLMRNERFTLQHLFCDPKRLKRQGPSVIFHVPIATAQFIFLRLYI